jgi:hypothetical protein
MMIRRKMVVIMETMAAWNQIEKSNSVISWTKNGVLSCHSRKNQTIQ